MNIPTTYTGNTEDLPDYFRREVLRIENHYGLLQRFMNRSSQPTQSVTRDISIKVTNHNNPHDLMDNILEACEATFCFEERYVIRKLIERATNNHNSALLNNFSVDSCRAMASRLRLDRIEDDYTFLLGDHCWSSVIRQAMLNSVELPYTLLEVQAGMQGKVDGRRVMGDAYRHPQLRCLEFNTALAFTCPGTFETSSSNFELEEDDDFALTVKWKRTTHMDLNPDLKVVLAHT